MKHLDEYLHWYFDVEDLEQDQEWGVIGLQTLDPKNEHPLPEPATIFLLGLGLIVLAVFGQMKQKKLSENRTCLQRVNMPEGEK
jgi:hypothetical protein